MANQNMTHIALIDGTPPKLAAKADGDGELRTVRDTMELTALAANDTVVLFRVPVDAKLDSLKLANDALGTTLTINIGFHRTDEGTTAVDADAIGTAIDVSGALGFTEYRYETKAIETIGQTCWELAGLSERPSYGMFDVTITCATSGTPSAGSLSVSADSIQ